VSKANIREDWNMMQWGQQKEGM